MNLSKKRQLASKALKVGKNRILFSQEALSEIKEAVTKQDIISLKEDGMISISPVKGRKKIKKRKTKRGPGKIKKKVNKRKQLYVKITRKLRKYVKELKLRGFIDRETYWDLRKKIKMKAFKSQANLKEYLKNQEIEIDSSVAKKIKKKDDEVTKETQKAVRNKKTKSKTVRKTK